MSPGLENIATAFAGPRERNIAGAIAVTLLLGFLVLVPAAGIALPEVPAFLPTIFSAASLAQILTAILLFVQWRITGLAQLALLAIAFAIGAMTGLAWLLAYPNVFSQTGLLGARPHTSGWLYVVEHSTFGAVIIAFALLDRFPRVVSRREMRAIGLAVLALVLAAVTGCIVFGDVLPATSVGFTLTPMFRQLLIPFLIGEYSVVLAVIALTGTRTVARVWLLVVCGSILLEIITSGGLSSRRFSLGWYVARFEHLISSSLMLYVFFVKINDLLVRLASRNRRLLERTESDAVALAEGEQQYRFLTNALPQLIWTADPHGNIDYVNARWIAFTGIDLVKAQSEGWLNAVHPADREAVRRNWNDALIAGDPLALEYRMCDGATGTYRWFLINALATRDARGFLTRWIATSTDIDVAKRIEERESFLALAGEQFAASIDIGATLATATEIAVRRLCDWCQIDIVDDDGRFVPAAVRSNTPAHERLLRILVGRRVESAAQEALDGIVARGEAVVIRTPREFASILPNVRDRVVYRRVPAAAAIVVPLRSGDKAIGTLSLVFSTARSISSDDISLARDFARRAALALEHAWLYERERATADALQRAMLPAQLPLIEHVTFSASYSAASESQRVGGDFYDAFRLPDGRVALTIGDVTGHGLEAAVIMGEVRQALRAAAYELAAPSAILDRASRLLVASGRTVFVTAIFGVLDTQTGRFSYSTAGHPAPLLFAGGTVASLASSGLPIGLRDGEGVDFTLNLHAPLTLTLYTDGLIEFARDIDDGERRIRAAIVDLVGHVPADQLAASIMQRVLGSDAATDDIAILTATIDRFPAAIEGAQCEWQFRSTDARTAIVVRHAIGELIADSQPANQYVAELTFGELMANAVRHAPGSVTARCTIGPDGVATIELDDSGLGFTPQPGRGDLFAESGRGLDLLRQLTAGVTVTRTSGGGASVQVQLPHITATPAALVARKH